MLTFVLLVGMVSIVRRVIGPSPISRAIPGIHAELWIVGRYRRVASCWADSEPAGKGLRGARESSHLAGYVAFRCFPRGRGCPLRHRSVARFPSGLLVVTGPNSRQERKSKKCKPPNSWC